MSSPPDSSTNDDPEPVSAGSGRIIGGSRNDALNGHPRTLAREPNQDEQALFVDQRVLRDLEEDFDSPSVAQEFARDYARSWEGKYQRLAVSFEQRDQERVTEAVLSVKVTSIMVGAVRLAQLAACFEQLITNQDLAAADQVLTRMKECGAATLAELQTTYLHAEAPTQPGSTDTEESTDSLQEQEQEVGPLSSLSEF